MNYQWNIFVALLDPVRGSELTLSLCAIKSGRWIKLVLKNVLANCKMQS